ncbi:hypothetical protein KW783_03825 [Candidatus Parcubacteria bacterium]|nr:hypothetical protein [Candidatus Parcubacteria bacterium]
MNAPVMDSVLTDAPGWFNRGCTVRRIKTLDREHRRLELSSLLPKSADRVLSAAALEVKCLHFAGDKWEMNYTITYPPFRAFHGRILTDAATLRSAFGLDDGRPSPGFFERDREFLALPGRGFGEEGEPNCCVLITSEMREAVQSILS